MGRHGWLALGGILATSAAAQEKPALPDGAACVGAHLDSESK